MNKKWLKVVESNTLLIIAVHALCNEVQAVMAFIAYAGSTVCAAPSFLFTF